MGQTKKGSKLRRSGIHASMYAAQFHRTARNKIRRLQKRVAFDKTAAASIERIHDRENKRK